MIGNPQIPHGAAERRQLTVLFCDLVGSTALSSKLDAEDYREVVMAYQKVAAEVIERYDGRIAQYLGDGLLVYFGHPVAHEDDAERALRCGYDIQQAIARLNLIPPLQARVGIHTGPVVVGQMGSGGRQETLAMGDTLNLAARLQAVAAPGTVVISDATLKLVRGLAITKDLGPQVVKGLDKPLNVFQVIQPSGVRTRLEAAERLTPFVGREGELALLHERWQLACKGKGQAVLISAEPGLGKSRLLLMVHARMQDTVHSWLECRASPMTRNSAYQPISELLHHALKLKEDDTQDIKLQRLEQGLDAIGIDKSDAVPLMAPLLSLNPSARYPPSPYGPELKRRKTMEYLATWVLDLAKFQPLVLVVEDLHWADPSSLELLSTLLERIATATVLVLMTGRPDFAPQWPPHVTCITLRPLPDNQVATMLDSLTGHKRLPAAVADKILERANGVPLFIEEITKQILESGQLVDSGGRLELTGSIDQLSIPTSLQDSLMARLDKQGEAKDIAQLCAVIGRDIPYKLLALVTEREEVELRKHLKKLTEAELLYQRGHPPDSSYVFKHALIRDAAYNSLLRSTRQQLHGNIATTLEQHFKERAKTEPAVLAEHFEKAGNIERAVKYFKIAGEGAADRTATGEATSLFEKALGLLPALPESVRRNRLELALLAAWVPWTGAAKGYAHPAVRSALERARGLLADANDPFVQTIVLGYLHISHQFAGQFELAVQCAEETAQLGKQLRMPILERNGHSSAALSYWSLGRFGDALASTELALRIGDLESDRAWVRMAGVDPKSTALMYRAWTQWYVGFPDDALALAQQAVARAESLGVPMASCIAVTFGPPIVLRFLRQADALLEACSVAAAFCEKYGYTDGRLWTFANMGVALGMLGRLDEGLSLLRQGIEGRETHGTVTGLARDYLDMSRICLAGGRLDEARAALEQAFELMQRYNERATEAEQHRLNGELLLAEAAGRGPEGTGAAQEAEACFHKAIEVSRGQRARSLELRAATSLARLWQQQNRMLEAREALKPVYDGFTEGFDTPDLKDARALLDQLSGPLSLALRTAPETPRQTPPADRPAGR